MIIFTLIRNVRLLYVMHAHRTRTNVHMAYVALNDVLAMLSGMKRVSPGKEDRFSGGGGGFI